MVRFDKDGKIYTCFSVVVPFSEEIITRLDRLNPNEQYELLTLIRDNKAGKQLILMRGCPGSGKSTTARKLAGDFGQVFSTDDYFSMSGKYIFNGSALGEAHDWNQRRSLEAIRLRHPIVVIDNTNTTVKELKSYLPHIELARELHYTVSIAEPETDWRFDALELFAKGSHNVPVEHIEKMLNRYVKDVLIEDILF
jgi:NEDD4-binding protein 2